MATRGGAVGRGAGGTMRMRGSTRGKGQTSASSRERGALAELPLLQYSARGATPAFAVVSWFSSMENYVRHHVGEIGVILDLSDCGMKYPVVDPPSVEEFTEDGLDGFPQDLASLINVERVKMILHEYHKKKRDLSEQKAKVYALIMGQLSAASIDAMKRTEQYAEMAASANDPLKLAELVLSVHMTRGSSDPVKNQQYACEMYHRLAVEPGDLIAQFRGRFDATVRAMKAVGEPTGDPKRLAIEFTRKLELSGGYRQTIVQLMNSRVSMDTVDAAVRIVSEYKTLPQPVVPRGGISFLVERGTVSDDDHGEHTEPTTKREHSKRKQIRCFGCGKLEHIRDDCPQPDMVEALNKEVEDMKQKLKKDSKRRGMTQVGFAEDEESLDAASTSESE
ncbi:hypothetical protein FVE85_7697 [Porphyridium purpureum]|uniref:CCHC-type domain-containing protein n=1 Tax=Porphyridium purpureum TaxID=35688 RepID=A0A5J4YIG9_PORPP|nr:hypothetical protein FVE85_7697 [Porphyridium purpureum]|eukprot:POR7249..scf210_14